MLIDQGDLLYGMDRSFIKEFMEMAAKEAHPPGEFIFREGAKADYFYTLIEGSVRLTLGDAAQDVPVGRLEVGAAAVLRQGELSFHF